MFIDIEWGEAGARAEVDTSVIIDVLSFSTATTLAVERGMTIYPFPDPTLARRFGEASGIDVAGKRTDPAARYTLSPASFLEATGEDRLILPSPNGSRLSGMAAGQTVLIGCLRNARAVAEKLRARGDATMLVPAGERWPDGTIRFALEDYLGAGAILRQLNCDKSAEARVCEAAFSAVQDRLTETLLTCRSGRELTTRGYQSDVTIAAQIDLSPTVPQLIRAKDVYSAVLKSIGDDLGPKPIVYYAA